MTIPHPAGPLLLVLLATTPATAQRVPEEWDTSGARHLELTAENAGEEQALRISPHHPTTLVFNTLLLPGGVRVEDEHLVAVAVNESRGMVTLLPSDVLPPDRPLTVTVRFADGAVPERVSFRLVVHPTRAEHQVRVYRQPRSGESYRLEARQERERAEQCETALALERTHAEGQNPQSLAGLFEFGLVGDGKGLKGQEITKAITQRSGETLKVQTAFSYRAEKKAWVAVELWVQNPGTQPWTAEGLEGTDLVSPEGVRLRIRRVRQGSPIEPGQQSQLVVEAEGTEEQVRGTFLLKLREAGGGPRTLTVRGITFP